MNQKLFEWCYASFVTGLAILINIVLKDTMVVSNIIIIFIMAKKIANQHNKIKKS